MGLSIGDIPNIVMALVMGIITLGLGLIILVGFQDTIVDTTSDAYTSIGEGITALGSFSQWYNVIIVVIAAVIVIGTLAFLRMRQGE